MQVPESHSEMMILEIEGAVIEACRAVAGGSLIVPRQTLPFLGQLTWKGSMES